MLRSAVSPLHDHAFKSGEFFVRKARCLLFKLVQELSTLCFDLSFSDIDISFLNALTSAHMIADSFFRRGGLWAVNPLSIVYMTSIETITSPPGCKLFYCSEMS